MRMWHLPSGSWRRITNHEAQGYGSVESGGGLVPSQHTTRTSSPAGEKQRTAIARAIVNRPVLLLADEPTGNLDQKNAEDIMRLLERINGQGTTVLVVSHNQELVRSMHRRGGAAQRTGGQGPARGGSGIWVLGHCYLFPSGA